MALTWQDKGGVAELTQQSDPETGDKLQAWAGLAEAELVLQRFSKGGMQCVLFPFSDPFHLSSARIPLFLPPGAFSPVQISPA